MAESTLELRGDVLRPGDADYEDSRRIWNGMIDKRPALIARCATVDDVREALDFARRRNLLVAVRGGGHGVAGYAVCDDGLVIDLAQMNGVDVDAHKSTVRAGGGCRLGDVDRATQDHGLAVPLGVVSQTGIAGLTLSGGIGWLRRKHGLSSDNLVSVEIVTADGRLLTASEYENADLFWGVRGGSGNFGVVTAFEYRAHPVGPEVMVVFVLYPGELAREVLQALTEFMADAADEFAPLGILGRVPHAEMFPVEVHGEPYAAVAGVYAGDVEEGTHVLQPLRELGEPIADLSEPMPYAQAQTLLDEDYPDGWFYYWKSLELDRLSGEAVDRLLEHAAAAPSDHSTIDVWYHGGAMSRVASTSTAFGDRPLMLLGYEANFEDRATADANVAWVRDSIEELKPFSDGGAYLNFPGFYEEGEELLRASYGDANYERLVALKNEYDPTNLFRLNGNIRPTAT
jgi:FAD/FMN-containing dehydrogenase